MIAGSAGNIDGIAYGCAHGTFADVNRAVTRSASDVEKRNGSRAARPRFEILAAKLEPPADRPGTVVRTALLDHLAALPDVPLIGVVAPPGYGKTTLLAQWARRRGPSVAWLSCDDSDNDPAVLMRGLVSALGRAVPAVWTVFRSVTSSTAGVAAMSEIVSALGPVTGACMVIDHAESVTDVESRNVLAEFALNLPVGWQLAIASRHSLPLPTGRLRARGEIAEIGAGDLTMGSPEASALIAGASVTMPTAHVDDLVARTEGWPAGLYLAALSIQSGTPHRDAGFAQARDESYMTGYLRAELLDKASRAEVSFLIRTSMLDRMTGSLCDAVLRTTGSARVLDDLAGRNLLVIPLDRQHQWYRYHQILRHLLRSELRRREPELIRTLDVRASQWFHRHDMPEAAISHAQAADESDRVAALVLEVGPSVWATGRAGTILRWMEWLESRNAGKRYPAIAAHGALTLALLGRTEEAERWAAIAEQGDSSGTLADGSTVQSTLDFLRVNLCRDGVAAMRRDAQDSRAGLSPSSPHWVSMLSAEGVSYLIQDDPGRADPILANAYEDARRSGVLPLAGFILAERCLAATAQGRWPAAGTLADQALAVIEDGHLDDYWTSALVFACAASAAVHRGVLADAREQLARAARLRPLLTHVLPVVSVQALLQMARVYIALADAGGAKAVLRQAAAIRRQRPDLGNLWARVEELQVQVRDLSNTGDGVSSLTAAELRVVPLLSTHLSIAEIAQELHVSRDTVKSQLASIYRKLRVTGRAAVVKRAGELSL
jgi:LuxR family maltose regulon positive regulatory protein